MWPITSNQVSHIWMISVMYICFIYSWFNKFHFVTKFITTSHPYVTMPTVWDCLQGGPKKMQSESYFRIFKWGLYDVIQQRESSVSFATAFPCYLTSFFCKNWKNQLGQCPFRCFKTMFHDQEEHSSFMPNFTYCI